MPDELWYETFTGKIIYPYKPNEVVVDIRDISHALSHVCRFGGHSSSFYSVAQHSVLVSQLVSPRNAFLGLMHDATEAYLGDMVRPIKHRMQEYQNLEAEWESVISKKYGIVGDHDEVKEADNHILSIEVRKLIPSKGVGWPDFSSSTMCDVTIDPWASKSAEKIFLARFYELNGDHESRARVQVSLDDGDVIAFGTCGHSSPVVGYRDTFTPFGSFILEQNMCPNCIFGNSQNKRVEFNV